MNDTEINHTSTKPRTANQPHSIPSKLTSLFLLLFISWIAGTATIFLMMTFHLFDGYIYLNASLTDTILLPLSMGLIPTIIIELIDRALTLLNA